MLIVGIDPGAYGALALMSDDRLVSVHDMPRLMVRRGKSDKAEVDGYTLADLMRELRPGLVYIEQVGGITGQSASAAFTFGRAAGAVEYTAKALGCRVEFVAPVTWKRALKINSGKDGSRAAAMKQWPSFADQFKRKKDDGRAEAALVALWGFQQQKGNDDERPVRAAAHDGLFE